MVLQPGAGQRFVWGRLSWPQPSTNSARLGVGRGGLAAYRSGPASRRWQCTHLDIHLAPLPGGAYCLRPGRCATDAAAAALSQRVCCRCRLAPHAEPAARAPFETTRELSPALPGGAFSCGLGRPSRRSNQLRGSALQSVGLPPPSASPSHDGMHQLSPAPSLAGLLFGVRALCNQLLRLGVELVGLPPCSQPSSAGKPGWPTWTPNLAPLRTGGAFVWAGLCKDAAGLSVPLGDGWSAHHEVIDATSWLNAVEGAFSRGCRT